MGEIILAVKFIKKGNHTCLNVNEYVGLSTDTKPTDCNAGSTFYELDTGNSYIFDGVDTWYPL